MFKNLRQIILMVCITLGTIACSNFTDPSYTQPLSTKPSVHSAQKNSTLPATNAQIRSWYVQQVSQITAQNEQWIIAGVDVKERALRAYNMRKKARLQAREFMQDPAEIEKLRARDRRKYGDSNGPTFDYLVDKNISKGLRGNDVYKAIIDSAKKTNRKINKKYGVQ